MSGFFAFLLYFIVSVGLLATFMFVYEKVTPYREFAEIKAGNIAAAIAFGGAFLGFTFPLVSAIFFTHSVVEMIKWAVVTGALQLALFVVMHRLHGVGDCVKNNNVAGAILLAFLSVAVGLLNAVSISY